MRDRTVPSVEEIELIGGRLCLDFVNTANRVDGQPRDERFESYRDVLLWSARLGLITRSTADSLAAAAGSKAGAALQEILDLRECLWRTLAGQAQPRDIATLEKSLRRPGAPRLKSGNGGIVLHPARDRSNWLVLAVAWSATELLSSSFFARVKVCPGDRCGWLFLDASPNSRRKWCSMKACGNRHKAQEHYNRLRAPPSRPARWRRS